VVYTTLEVPEMRKWPVFALLLGMGLFAPLSNLAQEPSKPEQQEQKIVIGTSEVVVDAIVRDKKGHLVKDLKASDFELSEDGVPQTIRSFRLIERGPSTGSTEAATPAAPRRPQDTSLLTEPDKIGVIALVFDRLSPDARAQAQKAALGYLSGGLTADDFIGVFGIDLSLRVLQTFTNSEQRVRAAIEKALSHSSSTYASSAEQINDIQQQQAQLGSQLDQASAAATAGGASAQGMASQIGAASIQQTFNQMIQDELEAFERLEHDQQGFATTNGLQSIIESMRRLPGRKEIILFSEGISIPPSVQDRFRTVIGEANRASVAIYTVDAAGLRTTSAQTLQGQSMTSLGTARINQTATGRDTTRAPLMRDLERNEDLIRQNPDSGLGQLAGETGGLFINNTNDLAPRLRRVEEDLHSHYVLTYASKNENYDGKFRQISLKINRPGLEVQTRKGYFGINTTYNSPVLPYEGPALAILSGDQHPNAFPSRAGAFSFPDQGRTSVVPVIVEVPTASLTFNSDNEKKAYNTDFSVVVLIKDESNHVVKKLSNQYLLTGPLDKLEPAKRGKVLFYREAVLEQGRYTVSSVVYDALSSKASTSPATTLLVPGSDSSKLRLSSLILIKSAERVKPGDQQGSNPFHFGEVVVYPNLGEPLHKSVSKDLAFFVTVYPAQGAAAPPKLSLELLEGGRSMGKTSLILPAPDQSGRIQYASAIPIEQLQPGDCELRVTVQDAQTTVARTERFTIQP
jgi:VWFA-related protein